MLNRFYIVSFLLFVASALGALASSHRPNVVILYADDMGYGDLSANDPNGKIPTPHLDQLAARGMRFTDGHSSSGICTPSRFALLTGQYHWRRMHGIVQSFGQSVFESDDFTIAKLFQKQGYKTAAIGKWHLGWDWQSVVVSEKGILDVPWPRPDGRVLTRKSYTPEAIDWTKPVSGGPLDRGFDYYFGDGTINFPPYCYIENDRVLEAPTVMMDTKTFKPIGEGGWEFRPGPMVEGWDPYEVLPTITDKAVAWIEQQSSEQPFFLYFAFPSPHAPIIPNDEFLGTSEAGAYGDFVVETDAMAGRILQALKDAGLDRNTIVIFTADNGAEQYAFEREQKFEHWSSGEFRGLKRDLWEGGHRVPTIISWPGVIEAGTVSNEVISQVDLAATFADLVGYKLNLKEAIDSYSLLPFLEGKDTEGPLRAATVQNTQKGRYALRSGDWVYINGASGEHTKSPEWFNEARGYQPETTPGLLYNLESDPAQKENLYAVYPERVQSMQQQLDEILNGQGQRIRKLYAVGYQLPDDAVITHPDSNPLRDALKPVSETAVFKMDGWCLWDPSLIKVGDTYHLFCSRWPKADDHSFDSGWKRSHVIRATSKNLFGPYEFQEVVLHPSEHPWATKGIHNPKITKVGDKYLLYHLGIPQWSTGFAYADSIEGPWEPVPDPVVKANNPALLVHEDGSAYMVSKHKPKPTRDGRWDACMKAHVAEHIDGPYKDFGEGRNRLPYNCELEDPTIWWANDQYNVICTDWEGKVTGVQKPLVYYTSKDGINYELFSKIPVWTQEEPILLEDGTALEASRIERPQVYINDAGEFSALLVAVGIEERSHDYIVIRPVDNFVPEN